MQLLGLKGHQHIDMIALIVRGIPYYSSFTARLRLII